jgi:hypothetical protein
MIPNFDCPVGTTRDERLGMKVIPFYGINCHVMSLNTKYNLSMKENKAKIKRTLEAQKQFFNDRPEKLSETGLNKPWNICESFLLRYLVMRRD